MDRRALPAHAAAERVHHPAHRDLGGRRGRGRDRAAHGARGDERLRERGAEPHRRHRRARRAAGGDGRGRDGGRRARGRGGAAAGRGGRGALHLREGHDLPRGLHRGAHRQGRGPARGARRDDRGPEHPAGARLDPGRHRRRAPGHRAGQRAGGAARRAGRRPRRAGDAERGRGLAARLHAAAAGVPGRGGVHLGAVHVRLQPGVHVHPGLAGVLPAGGRRHGHRGADHRHVRRPRGGRGAVAGRPQAGAARQQLDRAEPEPVHLDEAREDRDVPDPGPDRAGGGLQHREHALHGGHGEAPRHRRAALARRPAEHGAAGVPGRGAADRRPGDGPGRAAGLGAHRGAQALSVRAAPGRRLLHRAAAGPPRGGRLRLRDPGGARPVPGRRALSGVAGLAAGSGRSHPPAGLRDHMNGTGPGSGAASDGGAPPVLVARGIQKAYETPRGRLEVLQGLDLEVKGGTIVAILGASGSGKSTLLNILGTLDRADAGMVEIRGWRVDPLRDDQLAAFRARRLGFVFQFHHLLPEFSAEENVMMPLLIAGEGPGPARERAQAALADVGLAERWDHRPAQLSGGEAQRVAVARALVAGPELVLADEPSGNLDQRSAAQLHELIASLARERRQTFVVVTHNDRLAAIADRVLTLEGGRLTGNS